ncbi:MAG: hypothetical protein LBU39_11450 [Desulfobulbaceae bacterium]|nr:hypothetical protein [Desulfobulbaceae bacterium]
MTTCWPNRQAAPGYGVDLPALYFSTTIHQVESLPLPLGVVFCLARHGHAD